MARKLVSIRVPLDVLDAWRAKAPGGGFNELALQALRAYLGMVATPAPARVPGPVVRRVKAKPVLVGPVSGKGPEEPGAQAFARAWALEDRRARAVAIKALIAQHGANAVAMWKLESELV